MPAVSPKQQRFMAMCAHGGDAKGKCPPKDVAEEFSHKPADGYKKIAKDVVRKIRKK